MISVEQARRIRALTERLAISLSDDDALTAPELFPKWDSAKHYAVDDRVRYETVLYKCLIENDAQEGWNPRDAVSLWAEVHEGIQEWKQPGSTNPYMMGDKVRHNGLIWVSDMDNNVWEPGVYGWSVVE